MTALSHDVIESFRRDGFVHIPAVLSSDEVVRFRTAAARVYEHGPALDPNEKVFKQVVNVWRDDPEMSELTLHAGLAQLATELAGEPVRIWHDHLLVKAPHNEAPTEFHQDAPYWPHADQPMSLSAWIALVDVPEERGCMTFMPGQHHRHDVGAVNLHDSRDLLDRVPELSYAPRVTLPLRAGDVTFHHGLTPHTASSNRTDEPRIAFVNIYVARDVRYNGVGHVVTDPLHLPIGAELPDDMFPPVP